MIVVYVSTQQVGVSASCSARKVFEIRCSEIASEALLGEKLQLENFYSFSSMWDDGRSNAAGNWQNWE